MDASPGKCLCKFIECRPCLLLATEVRIGCRERCRWKGKLRIPFKGPLKDVCRLFQLSRGEMRKSQNKQIIGWVMRIEPHCPLDRVNRLLGPAGVDQGARHPRMAHRIAGIERDAAFRFGDGLIEFMMYLSKLVCSDLVRKGGWVLHGLC